MPHVYIVAMCSVHCGGVASVPTDGTVHSVGFTIHDSSTDTMSVVSSSSSTTPAAPFSSSQSLPQRVQLSDVYSASQRCGTAVAATKGPHVVLCDRRVPLHVAAPDIDVEVVVYNGPGSAHRLLATVAVPTEALLACSSAATASTSTSTLSSSKRSDTAAGGLSLLVKGCIAFDAQGRVKTDSFTVSQSTLYAVVTVVAFADDPAFPHAQQRGDALSSSGNNSMMQGEAGFHTPNRMMQHRRPTSPSPTRGGGPPSGPSSRSSTPCGDAHNYSSMSGAPAAAAVAPRGFLPLPSLAALFSFHSSAVESSAYRQTVEFLSHEFDAALEELVAVEGRLAALQQKQSNPTTSSPATIRQTVVAAAEGGEGGGTTTAGAAVAEDGDTVHNSTTSSCSSTPPSTHNADTTNDGSDPARRTPLPLSSEHCDTEDKKHLGQEADVNDSTIAHHGDDDEEAGAAVCRPNNSVGAIEEGEPHAHSNPLPSASVSGGGGSPHSSSSELLKAKDMEIFILRARIRAMESTRKTELESLREQLATLKRNRELSNKKQVAKALLHRKIALYQGKDEGGQGGGGGEGGTSRSRQSSPAVGELRANSSLRRAGSNSQSRNSRAPSPRSGSVERPQPQQTSSSNNNNNNSHTAQRGTAGNNTTAAASSSMDRLRRIEESFQKLELRRWAVKSLNSTTVSAAAAEATEPSEEDGGEASYKPPTHRAMQAGGSPTTARTTHTTSSSPLRAPRRFSGLLGALSGKPPAGGGAVATAAAAAPSATHRAHTPDPQLPLQHATPSSSRMTVGVRVIPSVSSTAGGGGGGSGGGMRAASPVTVTSHNLLRVSPSRLQEKKSELLAIERRLKSPQRPK